MVQTKKNMQKILKKLLTNVDKCCIIKKIQERREILKFKKEQTTQECLPFENIYENGLLFYKNSFIKILQISPINYDLKSNLEKEAILNSYKNFLKTCDFDIQILIQSKKEDISKTISQIKNVNETNPKILEIQEKYIDYISQMNQEKNSSSKNFYMIIAKKVDILKKAPEEFIGEETKAYEFLNECYFKIKETLTRCGNAVQEVHSKQNVLDILNSFISKN